MADTLWAFVAIGGPILIAAAVIYGLVTHVRPAPRNNPQRDSSIGAMIRPPEE